MVRKPNCLAGMMSLPRSPTIQDAEKSTLNLALAFSNMSVPGLRANEAETVGWQGEK
jgi:hypothetical protein